MHTERNATVCCPPPPLPPPKVRVHTHRRDAVCRPALQQPSPGGGSWCMCVRDSDISTSTHGESSTSDDFSIICTVQTHFRLVYYLPPDCRSYSRSTWAAPSTPDRIRCGCNSNTAVVERTECPPEEGEEGMEKWRRRPPAPPPISTLAPDRVRPDQRTHTQTCTVPEWVFTFARTAIENTKPHLWC